MCMKEKASEKNETCATNYFNMKISKGVASFCYLRITDLIISNTLAMKGSGFLDHWL